MKRIGAFLASPSEDILSAGFIIMGFSVLSGIFGLLRDKLLSSQFTPDLVAIYFASFVLPENIFQILVLGALGSAFIPVFSKYKNDENRWDFTLSFLHLSLGVFLIFVIASFIFIEPLSRLLVPGLEKENPQHLDLMVNLTRVILVSQLFFVVSYLFTGILQSFQRFLIPALAPVFYNLGILFGILVLSPIFGMYGVALGVFVGAILHLLIQLPYIRHLGFVYKPFIDLSHKGIWEIVHLMLPRTLSIIAERLKLTIDTILASVISLSSITFLNFALHVSIFPVSLFAAALGQAAFPFLAKTAQEKDLVAFKQHMSLVLTHVAFFLAPTTALFVVLHTPIVRLIFGSKLFSWEATFLTSWTFIFLSFGMLFQGMGGLLARGFFALYDTKTPLVVTFFSLLTTILLSLFFVLVFSFPVWSLGISTTIGSVLNAVTLFILLDRKIKGFNRFALFLSFSKIILISLFLGLFSYGAFKFFEQFFDTTYTLSLMTFTVIVVILSMVFYLLLSFIFNLEEYKELVKLWEKVKKAPRAMLRKEVMSESKLNP